MPVIDSQGKVFGRFNLVDVLLVALLAAAVPAAHASRALFRESHAQLTAISPKAVEQGADRLIELTGVSFRPYMRVSFGATQAASFQYYGATQAFVPVPALEPGTYDVVLYDHAREVARLPQAMSVTGLAAGDLAYEGARRILDEHQRMVLSGADREAFLAAIARSTDPSPRLVEALKRHRHLFG